MLPSAGDTAEGVHTQSKEGVGVDGELAVQFDKAEDMPPATARRKPNGEHVGELGKWEEVNDRSETPAEVSMAMGGNDGQPQGGNVVAVSADTSLPHSSLVEGHEELDASGEVNSEALAVLLRDFVRELGCESLVSIQACESVGQLRGVLPIECTVKGVVPGLGSIRLHMESDNI